MSFSNFYLSLFIDFFCQNKWDEAAEESFLDQDNNFKEREREREREREIVDGATKGLTEGFPPFEAYQMQDTLCFPPFLWIFFLLNEKPKWDSKK